MKYEVSPVVSFWIGKIYGNLDATNPLHLNKQLSSGERLALAVAMGNIKIMADSIIGSLNESKAV